MAVVVCIVVGLLVSCRSSDSYRKGCDDGQVLDCEHACDAGLLGKGGCFSAGRMYADGNGVLRNEKRAVAFFVKACDTDVDGCLFAAQHYQTGRGVELDRDRAVELYGQACAKNSFGGCEELAKYHEANALASPNKFLKEEFDKAEALFLKACAILERGPADGGSTVPVPTDDRFCNDAKRVRQLRQVGEIGEKFRNQK